MNKAPLLWLLALTLPFLAFGQPEMGREPIVHRNLPYVSQADVQNDSLQRLNLALPAQGAKHPLFIWIGGGAWSYVDRHTEMPLASRLARNGIAVASIGHRLSPAVWRDRKLVEGIRHPEHVKDLSKAVRWLVDHADMYCLDTSRIFIGGYSSGAHLAALIALDGRYLEQVGLSPDIFQGVIPISGTYDINDYYRVLGSGGRPELAELHVEAVFGSSSEERWKASPAAYLENLSAPMLIISDNVLRRYTELFERQIGETDFRNVLFRYADELTHGGLWRNLALEETSPYRDSIIDFIFDPGSTLHQSQ